MSKIISCQDTSCNSVQLPKKTVRVLNVTLKSLEKFNGDLSELIYYECGFCKKTVGLWPNARKLCEKLSGNEFYCSFCLRNNFNTKDNKHVMIMSFRSIIAYYYYNYYCCNPPKIWFAELNDYISTHIQAGNQNPIFTYDPETMFWFIDFKRVGKDKKKLGLEDILKTTINILTCFNLKENMAGFSAPKFYEKYRDAIVKFYENRFRPQGRKILIPTLAGCGITDPKKFSMEDTRTFDSKNLIVR